MKRAKKRSPRPREVVRSAAEEQREAMSTAVAEVTDAFSHWLHTDMAQLESTTHDYARGEYLSRHLVTLVEVLIASDRAAGGNGTGDKNEFAS